MAPYRPQTWSLGGKPTVDTDIPITAVYLVLYICGAITHMTILQKNNRRGHKFLISGMMFGFCMARTVTCTLRIASISKPDDISLSIAAAIFVAAGVVVIYAVNLIFTQRIVRAQHPHMGWHRLFKAYFISAYVLIVLTLTMLITSVIQSYYTLSTNTHRIDRDIQLYGATTYMILSFLPIPIVFFSLIVPRRVRVDKFGSGRFRTKIVVLLLASALVCCGATYRAATSWRTPVPTKAPTPWYYHRAYFYVFNFTVEVLVIYLYAFLRVDRRFHIPNGAHGPGSYRAGAAKPGEKEQTRGFDVYSEEETFDDAEDDSRTRSSGTENDKDLEAADDHKDVDHDSMDKPSTIAGPEYPGVVITRPESAATGSTLRPPQSTSVPDLPQVDPKLFGST